MKTLTVFWIKQQLRQGRVALIYILVFALFVINALVYSGRFSDDLEARAQYRSDIQQAHERIESPDDLAGSQINLVIPPSPLRFLADNNLDSVPNVRPVSPHTAYMPINMNQGAASLIGVRDVDLSFIVGTVLTFLALVLTFDAVNGERVHGTLRMLLTTHTSRADILISKILSSLAVLLLPILAGAVIHLLIMQFTNSLALSLEVLLILLFFMLFATLLLGFFVAVGVFVSALTRHPITSLVLLLLFWVACVVLIPGLARPLAKELHSPRSPEAFRQLVGQANTDFWNKAFAAGGGDRPPETARIDGFKNEKIWGEIRGEFIVSYQEIIEQQLRDLFRQAELARGIGRISPIKVFDYAVSSLSGSGYYSLRDFLSQAGSFKAVLFEFMKEQDALNPDSPHILYSDGRGYLSTQPIRGSLPLFSYEPPAIAERVESALFDLFFLFSLMMAAVVGGVIAINRYDVR